MAAKVTSLSKQLLNKVNRIYLSRQSIHTTVPLAAGQERRFKLGKAANKNKYGVLTDMPDYTYLDDRPTPLSASQQKRREERIELTKRIVQLVNEVQFARELYQKKLAKQQAEEEYRQNNALKAKVTT